jgi:hypothetical protein
MQVEPNVPINSQAEMQINPTDSRKSQVLMQINTQDDRQSQVEMLINDFQNSRKSQVNMQIDDFLKTHKSQVTLQIANVLKEFGSQVDMVVLEGRGSQIIINLYNVLRPRIMCEFPSRGNDGLNWTATSTEPGDFSINNVNNDIEELYWRSATGIKTGIILTCDVQSGPIFMDTFAILGHNFTTSATVQLQGSNDSGFSTIGFDESLTVSNVDDRIYYLAPVLPTDSFQYWRLLISDSTNTNDFLRIGIIVFGSATIFTDECATDRVVKSKVHHKDAVRIEGFTSSANDRSLKRAVRLNFRDLTFDSGDYQNLSALIDFARTTLKCLWIPDPRTQSLIRRFAVFGKLKKMPEEQHRVQGKGENEDFIDLTVDIDESE